MEIDQKQFFVTLFSNASKEIYPDNTLTTFTIHLAQPIDLGTSSNWEVGICEISYKPPRRLIISGVILDFTGERNVLIYCDLIATKFVGNDNVRLLRTFIRPSKFGEHHFHNVYYLPIEKRVIQDIHINLLEPEFYI